jgi:4-alpha-glucanotransferase
MLGREELLGGEGSLGREGLLGRTGGPAGRAGVTPEEFTVALYGFLARTPALLIGVSLAEAVGGRRPQNLPGTVNEYPNWRIPLTDGDGEPVLLEDLAARDGVRAVAQAVSGGLRPAAEKIRR